MGEENLDNEVVDIEDLEVDEEVLGDDLGGSADDDRGSTEETGESEGLEPWQVSEDQTDDGVMPVAAHVKAKKKLQGRLAEADNRTKELEAELARYKSGAPVEDDEPLVRPDSLDYDSEAEYQAAMAEYEDKLIDRKLSKKDAERSASESAKAQKAAVEKGVSAHYERAENLIRTAGISEEVYKAADQKFRAAIDAVAPGAGDAIADQFISRMGEGSERVGYFVGNNPSASSKLQSLLIEDPSGLKAGIYLGALQEKLKNPKKRETSAPAPAPNLNGGTPKEGGAKLKRKFDAAMKSGDAQAAYNIKKAARAAKVDVSEW